MGDNFSIIISKRDETHDDDDEEDEVVVVVEAADGDDMTVVMGTLPWVVVVVAMEEACTGNGARPNKVIVMTVITDIRIVRAY